MLNFSAFYINNYLFLLTRKFARRETSADDAVTVLIIVLILAVLLIISKTISFKDQKKTESANWNHIKSICKEKNLTKKETETLIILLKDLRLKHPLHAMTSMDVFDNFIMPRLTSLLGNGDAAYIRKKLFLTSVNSKPEDLLETPKILAQLEKTDTNNRVHRKPADSGAELPEEDELEDILDTTDFTGTANILPGEEIKLNFSNIPSMHSCGVMLNDENGIIVFLPKYNGEKFIPEQNTSVDGYLVKDDNYYYFESSVEEVFEAEVNSCRIRHAQLLHQIKRRQFARAELEHPFQFYHIPASELTNSGRLNKKTVRYLCEGILENISAGGGAVKMEMPDPIINCGDLLRFPIALPGAKKPIKVMGSVLKTETDKESRPHKLLLNLKFIGLDQGTRDEIIAAIFKILRTQEQS